MPKKKKAGKNKKNNSNVMEEKRAIICPDENGQIYGFLEKALGSRFFDVQCLDGKKRRCKVRKKRMKVKQGDCCIISLRDFDDKNADIVYRYNSDEVLELRRRGELPSDMGVSSGLASDDNEEDAFDFENI